MERECKNCAKNTTPKGKQCYTLTRLIKGTKPFIPQTVFPKMKEIAKNCKRFKEKPQNNN